MHDKYLPFQIDYVAGTLEETEMAEDLALLKQRYHSSLGTLMLGCHFPIIPCGIGYQENQAISECKDW